jgi:hypothetical protein
MLSQKPITNSIETTDNIQLRRVIGKVLAKTMRINHLTAREVARSAYRDLSLKSPSVAEGYIYKMKQGKRMNGEDILPQYSRFTESEIYRVSVVLYHATISETSPVIAILKRNFPDHFEFPPKLEALAQSS